LTQVKDIFMKKLIFVVIFLCYTAPVFAQDTMKIVYFNKFSPFSWENGGQMKGILIDVLTESIQTRMGIPVSHSGYPWARAQKMVKDGEADAFVTVPTPERIIYTDVSGEPVVVATFRIFIKTGSPKTRELKNVRKTSDLKDFKIGHYLGSGWAEKNLADMNLDLAPTLDITLKKLAAGRFDAFIDVSQVIRYRIRELGLKKQITELPNVIDSRTFNLCIGKKSPYSGILPKFDETLRNMREDGKLQEIYDKYK